MADMHNVNVLKQSYWILTKLQEDDVSFVTMDCTGLMMVFIGVLWDDL